jgi:hypothetical protein
MTAVKTIATTFAELQIPLPNRHFLAVVGSLQMNST